VDELYNLLDILPRLLIEKISARYVWARSYRDLFWFTLRYFLAVRTVTIFRLGFWRILHTIEVNTIEKLLPSRAVEVQVQLEQHLQLRNAIQNNGALVGTITRVTQASNTRHVEQRERTDGSPPMALAITGSPTLMTRK
jgi:hypothetical protein